MKKELSKKKKIFIGILILAALIFFTRIIFYKIIGPDYYICLRNWYSQIIQNGKIDSLGLKIGNYSPPYILLLTIGTYITSNSLFWIKFLSLIFDIVLALYSCLIVKHFNINKYLKIFCYIIVLPGVVINSAVLGQCDSIYTSFVIMFVYYILKDKKRLAMFLFGIALSFKLQAIFIAPVMLYLLITKKIRILDILYVIPGFFVLMVPTMIYGKSIIEIFMIYIQQTKEYPELVRSAPNLYSLVSLNYREISLVLKYLISIIAVIISIFISVKGIKKYKYKYDSNRFIIKVMLLSLIVPYILPGMMDRYFYMANIFMLISLFIMKDYSKSDVRLVILASIAYFIPVFTINSFQYNIDYLILSEKIGVSLISSTINLYVVYKYIDKYIFNDT
ncbi:MAG: hypothetical protein K0R72_596 [Clostridia bacterium]|jgi:Gpi18-like mannosyltransferase|nr:hypothetical protein [Clostridia bacterium]